MSSNKVHAKREDQFVNVQTKSPGRLQLLTERTSLNSCTAKECLSGSGFSFSGIILEKNKRSFRFDSREGSDHNAVRDEVK